MTLIEAFRHHLVTLALPPGAAVVALSGGPDSVALLDLLVRTRDRHRLDLIVAHLDHGIHPESSAVADQVEALAKSYGLAIEIGRLRLGSSAGETLARVQRYGWLEAVRDRRGAGSILTAHHADDQIETVLMRVLAGSGPAGLAAMAPVSGRLVRPLLPFRHAQLAEHLEEQGLAAWLDPANSDPRHLRSWIRTEILPALRTRLPRVDENLQRVARQAARDRTAWSSLLDLLPELNLQVENEVISVAASALGRYDSALEQAVIIAAARRVGCRLGPRRIGRVLGLLKGKVSGSRVPLGGPWFAELSFDRLRIGAQESTPSAEAWSLEGRSGEGRWGRWRFHWEAETAPERQDRIGLSAWFTPDPLLVRGWRPGERLKPLGGVGRRLIVRCFQEVQVPRSRRRFWPVLAQKEAIIWIPGVCRSDALLPARGTEALRIDAEYA